MLRKFDLKVAITNLTSSCALEGKTDVGGFGHLHVMVDQKGITDLKPMDMKMEMPGSSMGMKEMPMIGTISMPCATTVPVDLSTWHSGPARITVMLARNDHMGISAKPSSVSVTVR